MRNDIPDVPVRSTDSLELRDEIARRRTGNSRIQYELVRNLSETHQGNCGEEGERVSIFERRPIDGGESRDALS